MYNAVSFELRDNGRLVSTSFIDEVQIVGQGEHQISYRVTANQRSRMWIRTDYEGLIVSENNYVTRRQITGHKRCRRYNIDSARTGCKPGYRLVNNSYVRDGRTIDNYECVPEEGCTGDPVYEDVETNSGSYSGQFSLQVAQSPTEREAERERLKQEQREREIIAKTSVGTPPETGQYTGDTARRNSQDTKYRIISPETFSLKPNGQSVPDIRYESVRYLSPEAVSNYVLRGYEVQSVNPDTPTSMSKPYGASVVANAKTISSNNIQIYNKERNRRKTFENISYVPPQSPKMGGVHKRENNRRVIS